MIPYFVIGGPYVAGWGCAGEESRRSGNRFDKHRGILRLKHKHTHTHLHLSRTHIHTYKMWCIYSVWYQSRTLLMPSQSRFPVSSSLPHAASSFLPQDPLKGTTFHPGTNGGALIKVLISDPAAFRNTTLSPVYSAGYDLTRHL